MVNNAEEYIKQVLNNEIVVGKYVKLSIQRHINDLKRDDMYFDSQAGDRAIQFFSFLKHTKGRNFAGKDFELTGWQAFIIYSLFGWKNLNGDRRFRLSYTEVAKKNGKSTLAAGIGLYMMIADKEPGAEIYSVATQRDQAKIVFNEARNMVKVSPDLSGIVTVFAHNLHVENTFSKFEALSSDQDSFEGKNPYCGIIDEFHAHKDDLLFNNIKAATVARTQSLIWIITTAGFNKEGPCYHFRKMCLDLLEGRIVDDGLFVIIFALDDEDDWHDKDLWVKANPNLNISVLLPALESEFQQAVNSTTAEVGFKTKNLNMWIDSERIWIPGDKWNKCNSDYPEFKGLPCYGAIDLSSTKDITCFGLLFKLDKFHWLPFFFVPDMTLLERVRKDNVNYDRWASEGHIIQTGGNVVDYEFIRTFINLKAKEYKIKTIQYDPWNSSSLVTGLGEDGAVMQEFRQGWASMSAPTKQLEKLVLNQEINFGGNPVMSWMNGNVSIKTDPAGNIKIDKSKAIEKVDGMVTLVMAIGGWMTDPNKGSVYDKRGILEI